MPLNPLTETQSRLWQLRDRGLNLSQIARMLGVSRQAVSKVLIQADKVVRRTLVEVAQSYKITVYRVDHDRGLLSGFSKALNSPVLITYSPQNGVNVWYRNNGSCADCDMQQECREKILSEARRLGIPEDSLAGEGGDVRSQPPAKLAERLFEIVFPRRRWR